jgi:hypothetical protein
MKDGEEHRGTGFARPQAGGPPGGQRPTRSGEAWGPYFRLITTAPPTPLASAFSPRSRLLLPMVRV